MKQEQIKRCKHCGHDNVKVGRDIKDKFVAAHVCVNEYKLCVERGDTYNDAIRNWNERFGK